MFDQERPSIPPQFAVVLENTVTLQKHSGEVCARHGEWGPLCVHALTQVAGQVVVTDADVEVTNKTSNQKWSALRW